jgi:hypothetical protein
MGIRPATLVDWKTSNKIQNFDIFYDGELVGAAETYTQGSYRFFFLGSMKNIEANMVQFLFFVLPIKPIIHR